MIEKFLVLLKGIEELDIVESTSMQVVGDFYRIIVKTKGSMPYFNFSGLQTVESFDEVYYNLYWYWKDLMRENKRYKRTNGISEFFIFITRLFSIFNWAVIVILLAILFVFYLS